jgi:hypothetical protein
VLNIKKKKRKSQDNNRTLVHVKNDHLNIVENKKSQEDKNDVISISDKKNSISKISKYPPEKSAFKTKVPENQLVFYKKIKHLFQEEKSYYLKFKLSDWEELATKIFHIYCGGKQKTYSGLQSVFRRLKDAEPVNPTESFVLNELRNATGRLAYKSDDAAEKSKKIVNKEKIKNSDSRDNFSSKVPAKTFKSDFLSKEDEEFIVLIKNILPKDIMVEANNVWNKSARQLLEVSHFKGIKPLQDYLTELSGFIKGLELRYCIQQLKAGLTRVNKLSRVNKKSDVSIHKVPKSNDNSNKKIKTSTFIASESSITSKVSTTNQLSKKSDVTSTPGIKAFNFTLEEIEPLFSK